MIAFDDIDIPKFKKDGIFDFFDLLLHAPSSYEDRRLASEPCLESARVYEIVVHAKKQTPKSLTFSLFCESLDIVIDAVFFKSAPYLSQVFAPQKKLFIYARLTQNGAYYQAVHPKVVTSVGAITPVYKSATRQDLFVKLVQKYLTEENKTNIELPEWTKNTLYAMHYATNAIPSEAGQSKALKFTEIFAYMFKFSRKKTVFPAKALKKVNIDEFVRLLPFAPTNSQLTAFDDVLKGVTVQTQSRRVFIGDVGSGKTVVIAFALFCAGTAGSIVLAPTSILAAQLHGELSRFLPHLRISLLTQKHKLTDAQLVECDAVVGTHALLYRDLPAFAALVVDEQHRFGSEQRAQIERLSSDGDIRPHYFQFSATPIPRTQALVASSIVDVTLMKDLPFERVVETKVCSKEDFGEILALLDSEISAGRQAIIVYPLVEESQTIDYMSIEEGAPFWQKRFDGVFVTHGRDKEKESVLEEFRQNGKLLVATTLVEVGVSLPRLSTIVIVGAERLGLATLHQLRGRVARNGLKGYCYLYTNSPANERLGEFSGLTSGFDIAELDLKYRSAGDILSGVTQSGKSFEYFDYATDGDIADEAKNCFENL
jgi:ATP-dependent DNA helicase RecG